MRSAGTSPTAPTARGRWRSSSGSPAPCPTRHPVSGAQGPPTAGARRGQGHAQGRRSSRRGPSRIRTARSWRPVVAWGGAFAAVVIAVVIAFALGSGGSSGTRVIQASSGSAELRIAGGHGDLIVHRLPQLPAGRIYEMWVQHGGAQPVPTGTLFGVTPSGTASVGVPGSLSGVSTVMVTQEPAGRVAGAHDHTRDRGARDLRESGSGRRGIRLRTPGNPAQDAGESGSSPGPAATRRRRGPANHANGRVWHGPRRKWHVGHAGRATLKPKRFQ